MPIPTKPNEQRIRNNNDFSRNRFASDCIRNKYALVIGSRAVLSRDTNPEAEGDSQKLLFDLTLRHKAAQDAREGQEEDEYQRLRRRVSNFTDLANEYNYHSVREWVYESVSNNDFVPYFDSEIEPTLMKLLETKCFRVVITTTIDPYIEIAMNKVWGEGNFDVALIDNARQTFRQMALDEFGTTRPILCYVFGKVDTQKTLSENRFVLSENDAMERISKWFEGQDNNILLKYIRKFRLLSVGCQFDDWMFRFFWFLLRGRVSNEADGQVAVEIKNDDKLKRYLEHEKVQMFADSRIFMRETTAYIAEAGNFGLLPRSENGVFISYAHGDRYVALPIFERLHEAGIPAWIDEEKLDSGADYEKRIRTAIYQCKVFMPILSSQVADDIKSGKIKKRWYHTEWEIAQNRNDDESSINGEPSFRVIPIVIGEYRLSEAYHQTLQKCINAVTAFETAKNNMEYLIKLCNR